MYELGNRGMTPDVTHELGSFLGVPAAYLLCVDDTIPGMPVPDETGEIAWLAAKWAGASQETRAIVRAILERAPPS